MSQNSFQMNLKPMFIIAQIEFDCILIEVEINFVVCYCRIGFILHILMITIVFGYPAVTAVNMLYLQGECTPSGKRIFAGIGESISGT